MKPDQKRKFFWILHGTFGTQDEANHPFNIHAKSQSRLIRVRRIGYSLYTQQQQSKPFVPDGIMDVALCWIRRIGIGIGIEFNLRMNVLRGK